MKSLVTRKIDEVGRVTIPREILKNLNWNLKADDPGTELEIFVSGREIVLRKYVCKCYCCSSNNPITEVQGIKLCGECIQAFENARNLLKKVIG